MAVKTFGSEILTSSDTNTYLANSGLVYVTSVTVGTGVSSVNVTGAFSSTYTSYKIVYSGGSASTNNHLALRFGSTATGYYGGLIYNQATAAAPTGAADNNAAYFTYAAGGNSSFELASIDVHNPFVAFYTLINAWNMSFTNFGSYNGYLANTTSYTDFTLIPLAGTITGGQITVYGYRKA